MALSWAAQDAVARYLANNKPPVLPQTKKPPPKPAPTPTFTGSTRRDRDDHGGGADPTANTGGTSYPVPSSGGDGGGNDTPAVENFVPTDFESYLGMFGLPSDLQKELTAIFRGEADANRAAQRAIAYVRGTTWYAQTYPGIQEALARGIVRDERDYRARLNDFNQVYQQYAKRDVRLDEYAQHLREGVDVNTVGRRFQGAAIADTYRNDWQYVSGAFGAGRLSGEETTALGQQQAGLDTPLGLRVAKGVEEAQRKLARVFEGQLATGVLSKLGQQKRPDIGA